MDKNEEDNYCMGSLARVKKYWESKRWTSFLESTAAGLQLNLTLIIQYGNDFSRSFHHPPYCPACRTPIADINLPDIIISIKSQNEIVELDINGAKLVVAPLGGDPCHGNLYVVAGELTCCKKAAHPTLLERAVLAQKLLTSFRHALNEGFEGGRLSLQLSALRQVKNIVLSLFNGEENILAQVFDLILSALIILSDAQGSWIEYGTAEVSGGLLIKGDEQRVKNHIASHAGHADTAEISNGENRVRLGVFAPADGKQTQDLLNLMAQECTLVLEIDHLFKLLHKQLPMILGAVGSAVVLVSKDGIITYVNHAAELLLEGKAPNLIGEPADAAPGPWSACIQEKTSRRVSGHMDNLIQKQELRWVNWQVSPLLDDEQIAGWLVLVDDRTDHHNWQEAARRAERLAVTAALAGSLAHELRNPLGAAKGMLQLIGRKEKPEQVKGYADLILREIDRVTNLLNEFLLLGRPAEMTTEPLDLAAFLQEITPLLKSEANNYEADIFIKTEEIPMINADPGQFTQAVLNLVRNALDAAGRRGRVLLNLSKSGNNVILTIKDNGPGLSAKVSGNLFKPFFTTKERGTGLGLPVAQAIVHNHGGNITIENAPGGGAICQVTLPFYARQDGKTTDIDVLVTVADNLLRYPSEQALRTAGFSVISAADLSEALLLKERYCPAVLIADKIISEPQNIEIISRTWPQAKTFAIAEDEHFHEHFIEANVFQIVTKPLDYVRLIGQVRKALNEI
ncbi:ATP-binding protein [Pelotomaculum terephthalicicum JT]|uniref:ATP-binding protein n=1 Tax=Pelotomaculum terephthalicicum TaxID=206393 RepID=UPI001F03B713|nr:ATP-binding protein [Pelotomaculum terephthalicicum]MCG9968351.1 ATP-binding protein [Pelotomaculum terephthalicicum JT]